MNKIDLEDRTAIVTGGAQGIGRAVAERLIASGAEVMIWDLDRGLAEQTSETIGCSFVETDVSDWARVRSAAARTHATMNRVDILVAQMRPSPITRSMNGGGSWRSISTAFFTAARPSHQ